MSPSPRIWCKQKSTEWWRNAIAGNFGETWWRENLRMSKETFEILCNELRPYIERQVTTFRQPISVEARVALTIWRLATNVEYRTIAELFGLGRSTVGEIVVDTCTAISSHLISKYVKMPIEEHLQEVIDGFEQRWGFPQTVGAIDGTHVPILKPQESASDYFNRKGYYSIIMQAVVDYRGIFLDINIGWPGKASESDDFPAYIFMNFAINLIVILFCRYTMLECSPTPVYIEKEIVERYYLDGPDA